MFRKELTTQEQIKIAQKKQDKALKKRDKLDKKHENDPYKMFDTNYKDERKKLNKQIARAITDEQSAREIAKEEAKHPKPAPKIVDNSKVFAPQAEVNIGSKNEGKIEGHVNFTKGKKSTDAAQSGKKKPKAKIILFCVAAALVLAGVIALTVKITNCVRDNQENSSTTFTELNL